MKTQKRSLNQIIIEIHTMIEFLQQEAIDDDMPGRADEDLRYIRDKLDELTGYSEMQGFGPEDR